MFACVYIPDFAAEAIIRLESELREQAVAVVEGRSPLLHVVAANERARQFGVAVGMTQVQAQAYAPSLQLRKRSLLQEQAAHAALLDCACAMSPRVHSEADDTVLVDVSGLERLFGPPTKIARELARRVGELGMEANVGMAANVESATHAARGFPGVTVIPRGKEAERLAPLPVDVLFDMRDERAQEMLDTLERWGVRTFRALALLPEVALSQRLGEAGVHLRKLTRGEGSRPLVPAEAPLEFEEAIELEDAIELLEPLLFVLNRMLDQLCARLATRSLATQELHLRMELNPQQDIVIRHAACGVQHAAQANDAQRGGSACVAEHALKFPVPMRDTKVFLKLLQLELRAKPPQAPVTKIWLRAEPARPRATQGGLFLPEAPEPEKLEVTLARIGSVLRKSNFDSKQSAGDKQTDNGNNSAIGGQPPSSGGASEIENRKSKLESESRVGAAEVLDTHRPDGFRMKRFVVSSEQRAAGSGQIPNHGFAPISTDSKSEIRNRNSEIESPASPCLRGGCLCLRRFRPALAARVRVQNGVPARLDAGEEHAGEIVWASGPWRASGEWWSEQQWSRDSWDVAVAGETVTVYRIYCERGEWWVEAMYD